MFCEKVAFCSRVGLQYEARTSAHKEPKPNKYCNQKREQSSLPWYILYFLHNTYLISKFFGLKIINLKNEI